MMAFIENWLECPNIDQIKGYTHVIISFAVSYVWQPGKNKCNEQCDISRPVPICANGNLEKVKEWQQAGTKVLLSFGGAGMGGSWSSSQDDCWEYCYKRGAASVASQLASIVWEQGFDGVDIDFEYFVTRDKAVPFLFELTSHLRDVMNPVGAGLPWKTVSHAPMAGDVTQGRPYYDVLKELGARVDYLLPQYYNGPFRPARDLGAALAHYKNLVDDIYGGDASKVVFGFCNRDCGGTGSNVNSTQAVMIMQILTRSFPDNGGAYLWAGASDRGNEWSQPVREALNR